MGTLMLFFLNVSFTCLCRYESPSLCQTILIAFMCLAIFFASMHHKFTKLNVTVMNGITCGSSPEHIINQILLTRLRAST